jgi:hypothetical protein
MPTNSASIEVAPAKSAAVQQRGNAVKGSDFRPTGLVHLLRPQQGGRRRRASEAGELNRFSLQEVRQASA